MYMYALYLVGGSADLMSHHRVAMDVRSVTQDVSRSGQVRLAAAAQSNDHNHQLDQLTLLKSFSRSRKDQIVSRQRVTVTAVE